MPQATNTTNEKSGEEILNSITQQNTNINEKVVIHAMPKKFLSAQKVEKKVKSAGMIVLVMGIIFLIVVLGLLFYILSNTKEVTIITGDKPINKDSQVSTTTAPKQENNPAAEPQNNISEEAVENIPATTTEPQEPAVVPAEPVVINEATTTVISAAPEINPVKITYKNANDTDNDGLFDTEENLLDCNQNSIDSDGDGYNDSAEFIGLYNPAGTGKLIVNPNIEKYSNSQYKYSVYYPKTWKINDKIGADSITFEIGNNQFIQINVQPNTETTLDAWYAKQFANSLVKDSQRMYKKGWAGVKSEDNLVAYLAYPSMNNVFVLSYNLGMEDVLKYKNIFEMMINSLEISQ